MKGELFVKEGVMTKDTIREAAVHFVDDKFGPIQAEPSTPQPDRGICVCGLAKDYHDPRFKPDHEYKPRYPQRMSVGVDLDEYQRLQRIEAAADGLPSLITELLRKYGGTMKGRGDHRIFDALVRYRAALATDGAAQPVITEDYDVLWQDENGNPATDGAETS